MEGKKQLLKEYWQMCPVRHILTIIGALFIAVYFILRDNKDAMLFIYNHITKPYHRVASHVCSYINASVAEVIIIAFVLGSIAYFIFVIIALITGNKKRILTLGRLLVTVICLFCLIYGGFCILWGVYYDTSSFEEQSGIERRLISVEELRDVTHYFTLLANEYSKEIKRDENGIFAENPEEIFEKAPKLYRNTLQNYPCLDGEELRPKAFKMSKILSHLDFTGFFFPFTGEANLNVHSPACMLPSTIAHELAHQRGVAREDEANFTAVLACMNSKDKVYCYSAALMAYTYLGNALYDADYDAWAENYTLLSDEIKTEFAYKREYWKQFETPVSSVSNTVYENFLESYRQDLGLKTYGACIDMLVIYYLDDARMMNN